jgi:hypothetical protein
MSSWMQERVGALARWMLLAPAIFLILLGSGQAGMASATIPSSADTTAGLKADYSPWTFVVVKPLNPAVYEVIQADRAEDGERQIALASPVLGDFWTTPQLTNTSSMVEPTSTAAPSSTALPTDTVSANPAAVATASPIASITSSPPAIPSPTPTGTPFSPPATATRTFTPKPTGTSPPTPSLTQKASPTITETYIPPAAGAFPHTGVLDSFDQENGGLGPNWSGHPENFAISANQLQVTSDTPEAYVYWNASSFGPNQEAYVTLINIHDAATEIDLHLKCQDPSSWGAGVLEVYYYHAAKQVYVWTFVMSQGWVRRGAAIPVTFSEGDQFGAVARSDGKVEVYQNGTLLGVRDVTAWPLYSNGGHVGLSMEDAAGTLLDDFGGGNLP